MAAQPPMVANIVPGTTFGQHPSRIVVCQTRSTVTPGSTSMTPVRRVPGENAVHRGHVEAHVVAVERRVAIALSTATEADGQAAGARRREHLADIVDGLRPTHPARAVRGETPGVHLLPGRAGERQMSSRWKSHPGRFRSTNMMGRQVAGT